MRLWWVLLLIPLGGCIGDDASISLPAHFPADGPLSIYVFEYPGQDVHVQGRPHGHLAQVRNDGDTDMQLSLATSEVAAASAGELLETGWKRSPIAPVDQAFADGKAAVLFELPAHSSKALLLEVAEYRDESADEVAGALFISDGTHFVTWVIGGRLVADTREVSPGQHVQTATVGVWANGTSFYTNIEALNDDPLFPAGYDRTQFEGDLLPVYVYDRDRSEQPRASRDACYFTTITGYNALLTEQAASHTGITGMRPEDAYTRPGNEEFFLYGEPLAFLNSIIVHEDDAPRRTADAPDPTGPCYDVNNDTPDPIPDVPPQNPVSGSRS